MNEPNDRPTAAHHAPSRPSREADVRRITWIGLLTNVVLAGLKMAAGLLGKSQVVLADGVHSLSDMATDVALLVGSRYWSKPPDEDHPHGHRRIETVVTLLIAASLAGVAAAVAYRALATLYARNVARPSWIAFAAAVLSIAVKEALFRWTAAVGRRAASSALVANAWHHRSDALSSVPAALAVAGAAVAPGWSFLDGVGALLVALFLLHAAWRIGWPALEQLVDVGASRKVREEIRALAASTDGVRAVHALRSRYAGSGIHIDLHVLVDPELNVRTGHAIAEDVQRRILDCEHHVVDVVVHIEPYEAPEAQEPPDAS